MARYDYKCLACGWVGERLGVKISECDQQICDQQIPHRMFALFGAPPETPRHYTCGAELKRSEEIPHSMIDVKGSFQTGAITSKGEVIHGRFGGTSAKIKKGWNKA